MESKLIPVKVGWQDVNTTFFVELTCPNELKGYSPESIIKNGHDTSVKDYPQYYECKDCNRHFYLHASGFFSQLKDSTNAR